MLRRTDWDLESAKSFSLHVNLTGEEVLLDEKLRLQEFKEVTRYHTQ